MASSISITDIEKAYNVLGKVSDQKTYVSGQVAQKDFYYARKIIMLYIQSQAVAGDATSQNTINGLGLGVLINNNATTASVVYNGETFSYGTGDVNIMTQDEAQLVYDKSVENELPLTFSTRTQFFATGKPNFYYW